MLIQIEIPDNTAEITVTAIAEEYRDSRGSTISGATQYHYDSADLKQMAIEKTSKSCANCYYKNYPYIADPCHKCALGGGSNISRWMKEAPDAKT